MKIKNTLRAFAIGTSLLAASSSAIAEDWSSRAAVSVGQYIAAQGNGALQQLKREMQKDVLNTLSPIQLPQPNFITPTRAETTKISMPSALSL